MKRACLVLMLYSISMVFYGSLEIVHDILHYMAEYHHSKIHSHSHDHHHSVRDHDLPKHHHHHSRVSHSHSSDLETDESLPSFINCFLFVQARQSFNFDLNFSTWMYGSRLAKLCLHASVPPAPPPRIHRVPPIS